MAEAIYVGFYKHKPTGLWQTTWCKLDHRNQINEEVSLLQGGNKSTLMYDEAEMLQL